MTTFTRDELALYVMGEHDDPEIVEAALANDAELRAVVADEARFEALLRDAADAATFCPGCGELVAGSRCDACGVAIAPGGYVVERVLVASPHGRMYVARDADGKHVALKELAFVHSPTLDMIAAFDREAKFLRALDHPAIPRFVASFEEGTGVHVRYYLAQELVSGQPLDARLADHFYREPEVIAIARQVLEVLVYLQSLSPMVIHRDIKPANLLVRPDGSIAVVDFGAAHVQGTTAGSSSLGTFGYMPIEQLAGIVDATTDPYALGASLLHLLTRREPWRLLLGAQLAELNVSRGLRAFLGKLVAPDPKHRFPNARAALDALERAEKGQIVKSAERPSWQKPTLVAAASLFVVAAGIGGVAMYSTSGDPERPTPAPVIASGDPVEREITELTALVDDACRCRLGDRACGERTIQAINRSGALLELAVVGDREDPLPDPGQKLRLQGIMKRGLECMRKAMTEPATVQVMLPVGVVGELWLDGEKLVPAIERGHQQTIASGEHLLEVVVADGRRCEHAFTVETGSRLTVECDPIAVSPRPHAAPPSALESLRKTGNKHVAPDDATRAAIAKVGKQVIGSFKLCIDERGHVAEIKPLKPTGFPAYDAKIEAAMKTWTFEPFAPGGKPAPVCTAFTFVYDQGP